MSQILTSDLESLLVDVRACEICKASIPAPNPVLRANPSACLLIVGQAPGTRVHASGIPRDDASGNVCLVFIEVKTRTNRAFGTGSEQVSAKKSLRLQAAAQRYLAENDLENSDWRIDLISIEMDRSGRLSHIEHIESAMEE